MSKNSAKGFIWYSLRIGFSLTVLANFLLVLVDEKYLNTSISIISGLWYISTIFTFIISIIHLIKYKEKIFAVISLVLSSILIILVLWVAYMYTRIII